VLKTWNTASKRFPLLQQRLDIPSVTAGFIGRHLFGVPLATILPPLLPPPGPMSMIQSAVLMTQIMLDDHDRIACVTSLCSTSSSCGCPRCAGLCRLVQYIERAAGGAFGEFLGELDACASPPMRGGGLAER